MLQVTWLNAYIPQTQDLADGSLDTWSQKDRLGVRLDTESVYLSLPSIKESKHAFSGRSEGRMVTSRLQQWLGEGEGHVRASGHLSALSKLR